MNMNSINTYSWDTLPKRWQLIILFHTGFIIEYCLRVNASVAVLDMKRQYGWTDYERGFMLSSFYWGYTFGQLPSNYIVQRTGAAKMTFACSIFFASLLTILLPFAADISFQTCLVTRACIGLAESAAFPAAYNMYPKWIPANEQTIMITCIMSGLYLGEIFCFLLSGYLIVSDVEVLGVHVGGWQAVFWVFGVVGLIWCPFWMLFIYDSPEDHPSISAEELALLTSSRHKHVPLSVIDSESGHAIGDDPVKSDIEMVVSMPTAASSAPTSSSGGAIASSQVASYRRVASHGGLSSNGLTITSPGRGERDPLTVTTQGHDTHTEEANDLDMESEGGAPWAAFLLHPASVTLIVCFWTQNWVGYLILSELPTYFTDHLGFGLKDAGVLSMAPYVAQFLSTLMFGFAFQWLQLNRGWSTRNVRQYAQHACFLGSSGCLLLCGFVNEAASAICLMVSALGFYGACQSGIACAFLDISPRYSSTLNTFANVFASLAGVMTPLVVSAFTDRYAGIWGWRYVFMLTAGQCVFASILWFNYQTSSVVKVLNTPVPHSKSFWSCLFDDEICALWFSCEVKEL
mmetsp:Transcript_19811/g.36886  ORF Transcript_19811/g.36886 Transcript_19811/m.36886 type:complete len:574 (-) Transcript_19811:40-1761(-)